MNRKKIDLDALFDVAAGEFGREGFSGARMDEIAERARVNKALIYYHVGDKQKLFDVVISRVIRTATEEINDVDSGKEGLTPVEYLESYMKGFYRFFRRHPDYPKVIIRELLAGGMNLNMELSVPLMELLSPLTNYIERGVDEGFFRPVSPLVIHLVIVSALNAFILGSSFIDKYNSDAPGDDILSIFFDVVLNGIRKENE